MAANPRPNKAYPKAPHMIPSNLIPSFLLIVSAFLDRLETPHEAAVLKVVLRFQDQPRQPSRHPGSEDHRFTFRFLGFGGSDTNMPRSGSGYLFVSPCKLKAATLEAVNCQTLPHRYTQRRSFMVHSKRAPRLHAVIGAGGPVYRGRSAPHGSACRSSKGEGLEPPTSSVVADKTSDLDAAFYAVVRRV